MLSYEPELDELRPLLGDAATDTLIARERREVFSLHPEVRILSWGGAMLVATAAGLVLKNHLDEIGPLALSMLMGLAAAGCYAFVWSRRTRATLVHDYVLLLGALLISADAAFIETQFHLFGTAWHRHFLILAVVHGVTAYLFRSRIVLSLAMTSIAGWLGVREHPFGQAIEYATRSFACAALLLSWRAIHVHFDSHRERDFAPSFEHFAANVAFVGCISLLFENDTQVIGALLMLVVAAAVIAWGIRVRRELFVLYAVLYAVIGVDALVDAIVREQVLTFLFFTISAIGAIVALFAIHARLKEWRA